jgi:hypothetical protein
MCEQAKHMPEAYPPPASKHTLILPASRPSLGKTTNWRSNSQHTHTLLARPRTCILAVPSFCFCHKLTDALRHCSLPWVNVFTRR